MGGEPYRDFIKSKAFVSAPTGLTKVPQLNPMLKEHQALLTSWALKRGRAAIFADTGLGKGWMILEWARCVSQYTNKPVLVLAPLAVSQQFARESAKLWGDELESGGPVGFTLPRGDEDVESTSGVCVTNYQKLHRFDVSKFGGVAIDESSILKSLDGKTRALLLERFADMPFKLSATATPSPNDFTELGGQAEFLGVMKHAEMLASFFIRDGGSTQDWRLKGHAGQKFWEWVCHWGAIVKMPSDIGCSDDGYVLPPLRYHEHIIPASQDDALKAGLLFAEPAHTLNEQRAARRGSLRSRVAKAAEIASAADTQAIVWCDLNQESEELAAAIPGSIEVAGKHDDDEKERRIEAFMRGEYKALVSKPAICAHGLNLQFSRTAVFCGVTNSFEQWFQAIRRQWRYGVDGAVDVHIVSSELEGNVVANLKRKAADAEELANQTRKYVEPHIRKSVLAAQRDTIDYQPKESFQWPQWLESE